MTVATTRSGRIKVPAIDKAKLEADAAAAVEAAVAGAKTARDKLTALSQLDSEAHAVIREYEPMMHAQALSLALHEGVRGVFNTLGVSRQSFSRMTADALGDWPERPNQWDDTVHLRARARKIRFYRNAVHDLPGIAERVVRAKATVAAIQPLRDDLIRELYASGMKRSEIAELIDRNPSRVSHITGGGERK